MSFLIKKIVSTKAENFVYNIYHIKI